MSAKASASLAQARAHLAKAILEMKQAEAEVFEVRGLNALHVGLGLHRSGLAEYVKAIDRAQHTPNLRTRSETPEEGP